jgi:uncharacterized repeat protein (TIGR03803 family)
MRIVYSSMAISLAALTLVGGALAAPVESVLHSFTGVAGDGAFPQAALIADESGALYGTTSSGGNHVGGIVFKLTPPGRGQTVWTETVLHSFTGMPGDGENPRGALIADEGALYGTTVLGGSSSCSGLGCGTVFKLTPPAEGQTAWTETVLYSFKGGNDGANPSASLIADESGALYGTTELGGSGTSCFGSGCGTVFKLTPPADGQTVWTETVLYRFNGGSDGNFPEASLIADERGALYGTTSSGGGSNCPGSVCGTVFKLTPPADGQTVWAETVLYSFKGGSDGANPTASLVADDSGTLYGTTFFGGSSNCSGFGCGTVFKVSPPTEAEASWTETVLYGFKGGNDGAGPSASLIADDRGGLYGTTLGGGVGPSTLCPGSNVLFTGCGTVFKLKPPGDRRTAWTETVLYRFTGGSDGSNPVASLTPPGSR